MNEVVARYRRIPKKRRYMVRSAYIWADSAYHSLLLAKINAWVTAWLMGGGETIVIDRTGPENGGHH